MRLWNRVVFSFIGFFLFALLTADAKDNNNEFKKSTRASSDQLLDDLINHPDCDFDEIVFAVRQQGQDWPPSGHYYANFGRFAYDEDPLKLVSKDHNRAYSVGGILRKLNLKTGESTDILVDERGGIRDPQVHYDGSKVLFSYRKEGDDHYHLYEINTDGSSLRQLTEGPFDDIEPTYLPDGDIVFISSRCKRWVNCWLTEVAVLHRCDKNGDDIRMISSNNEHDNTPSVLPDGRLLYTRWEYVDRSQVHYHHLWTVNPDGSNQMTYYGNMHPGIVMIDSKPIPDSKKVVSIFSPGHGSREHAGYMAIIDPSLGPDEKELAAQIGSKKTYRDPYPISETWFLAAETSNIVLMNKDGAYQTIYKLSNKEKRLAYYCHEPAVIRQRPRERVISSRIDLTQDKGYVVLSDVYKGRNMQGVKRGDIKKLLVLETLPKPINFTGGMEPLSYGGTFTLERILGTIPVEADGSAYAELPAMRSLFFVALDEDDMSIKRMQSFFTLQPGETFSCVGCHEQRTQTPPLIPRTTLLATRSQPAQIKPIIDIPDVIDFPRDIQPIFDKHCLQCHDYDKRKGGVILTGDRGPYYKHSFYTLIVRNQIKDGRNLPESNLAPRSIGSAASPLMGKISGGHHDVRVTDREKALVRLWIDTGSPAAGTYATLGSGMFGAYWANRLDRRDMEWPSMQAAMDAQQRRCSGCHQGMMTLPTTPSDDLKMQPWVPLKPIDPRRSLSRHLVYNLTRPNKSLLLLTPLAKSAGGYAVGEPDEKNPGHKTIFQDINDPDYQLMLTAITDAKQQLDKIKRFDMPGYTPRPEYVRELKRYGILPHNFAAGQPFDFYAVEQAYWRSQWYQPVDSE